MLTKAKLHLNSLCLTNLLRHVPRQTRRKYIFPKRRKMYRVHILLQCQPQAKIIIITSAQNPKHILNARKHGTQQFQQCSAQSTRHPTRTKNTTKTDALPIHQIQHTKEKGKKRHDSKTQSKMRRQREHAGKSSIARRNVSFGD
jgi:hypothetical protein